MNERRSGNNSQVLRDWLDYAYSMMRHPHEACSCEPYHNGGIRWPGYVGSNYCGVLFVGARHNANGLIRAGLTTNGPLDCYAEELRSWSAAPRAEDNDRKMLDAMRKAYGPCYDVWAKGGVWRVFKFIRDELGLNWDNVASVNLARCYSPKTKTGEDDQHILSHWRHCSLDPIVKALKPRIVFVSKDNKELRDQLPILGEELETPLVVRYANSFWPMRHGKNYKTWVTEEKAKWECILNKRGCSK